MCHPVLGLVLALVRTPRLTETTLPGTIRTTEVGLGAITVATGGPTTTVAETEATTHVVITRTGGEAMATSPIGRVGVGAGVGVGVEDGTIATMTRTITQTVPEGGALDPAHPRSAQPAAAAPTILTTHLQANLGTPDDLATPLAPGPHLHVIAVTRASVAPRVPRTDLQKAK